MIRGLASLALLVAVAACGGSSATPSPGGPGGSVLPAGTYTSISFQPPVTFTVPDGWVLVTDIAGLLQLQPADSDLIGIHLFRDPSAASQDAACPAAPEPGVARTSSVLSAWIRERPGLAVSPPTMVTVAGIPGIGLDVSLKADWTQSCPFANGVPSVSLFNSPAVDHWVVVGNERLRLYLLDVPGGGTVVVDLDAFDGDLLENLVGRAAGVVRSLKFAAG